MRFVSAGCLWLLSGLAAQAVDLTVTQSQTLPPGSPILIHQGTFSTSGGPALPSSGCTVRQQRAAIKFTPAFTTTPNVTVALTGFDISNAHNARLGVATEGLSNDGMTLVVTTWCDTDLWTANGTFIAVGVAPMAQ